MKKRSKYLLKNTAIFALGNFGPKLISFFLLPLYTHVLSTDSFGNLDLISTISLVLAPIIIININEAILRFALDDDSDQNSIMSTGLILLFVGIILSLFLIPIINCFSLLSNYSIYIYLYIISYASTLIFLSYLRGREKLFLFSIGNIINSLLIAIFNILFLLVFKLGIEGYLIAYILANLITSLYAIIAGDVYKVILNFKFDKVLSLKMIKYSSVLIPNTFLWWITNSSDRIMITSLVSASANGIYAISYKFPTLLSTFSGIFNQAWSYSAIKEDKADDKENLNNNIYNGFVSFLLIAAVGLLFIIKPLLKIYVSKEYYLGWKYTPFLIISFVFSSIGSFLATQYTVNKDSKNFLISALLGAFSNIILNFLLIPNFKIYGAALATCISYILVTIYRAINIRKYLKIKYFNKKLLIGLLLLFISSIVIYTNFKLSIILLLICFISILLNFKNFLISFVKSFIHHK